VLPREHSWVRQYVSHLDCRATAHLLHLAPPSRRLLPGAAALLLEPPPLPAQPPRRAPGQELMRAADRSRPSALADLARPGRAPAPASVTRGGWPPPPRTWFSLKSGPHGPALSRARVTRFRQTLNHARHPGPKTTTPESDKSLTGSGSGLLDDTGRGEDCTPTLDQAQIRFQHVATATAMNLVRVTEWLGGGELTTTRYSKFRTPMAQAA
jgi:hypothetical protein